MKILFFGMVVLILVFFCGPVLAQNEGIMGGHATAIGLTPFRMESNYMSVAGYLRWQTFLEYGIWISREQAVEMADMK